MNRTTFWLVYTLALVSVVGCNEAPVGVIIGPCSAPTDSTPPIVFGSRLRPYQLVANDGTTATSFGPFTSTWYDTLLKTSCAFRSVDGGPELLCLPPSIVVASAIFSDDTCLSQVACVPACANRPKFVSENKPDICWPSLAFVKPLGEPLPTSTPLFAIDGMGLCVSATPSTNGMELLPIGEAMPWSSFVAATQIPLTE